MNIIVIDQKLKELVKTERKIQHEILRLIQNLDITGNYRKLGYSHLRKYLIKEIGYSEAAAQRRIAGAQLMKCCPQIAKNLKEGSLNLTQLSLAHSAMKQEEARTKKKIAPARKAEILKSLEKKNGYDTEKILKQAFPHFEPPKRKVRPTAKGKVEVTLEFTEEEWKEIDALRASFSHKVPNLKIENILLYWAREMKKREAKHRAKHAEAKTEPAAATNSEAETPFRSRQKVKRIKIRVGEKISLLDKANHQCEYISPITGKRCDETHFLDDEHVQALARGGTNDPGNLRIFCHAHNLLVAKEDGISLNLF